MNSTNVSKSNKKEKAVIFIVIILLLMAFAVLLYVEKRKDGKKDKGLIQSSDTTHDISVIFINAGRADSILVLADGKSFLIDTGLSDSVSMVKNVLMKYNVDKLDGVFITHGHKDHIGGLKKISKSYDIDKLYAASLSINGKNGENRIEKSAQENKLNLNKLSAGDRIEIADNLFFEVLAPLVYNMDDDNDNSLVLRLYVNSRVFIFTGDMQFAEERTLLNNDVDLTADILKVGNHGNPDATSEEFAKAVSPEIAVITTDIQKDEDSANPRVKNLFKEVYVTRDYQYGIKVTVSRDGEIVVEDA